MISFFFDPRKDSLPFSSVEGQECGLYISVKSLFCKNIIQSHFFITQLHLVFYQNTNRLKYNSK